MSRRTVAERLERLSMPEPNSGCVLWLGTIGNDGYGRFQVSRGQSPLGAHDAAWKTLVGPVPDGLELDHRCRVRPCIAIWHLEPVTHRVNILRSRGLAAQNARKTECINGHSFDEINTYITPKGKRNCRICIRAAGARRAQKTMAAAQQSAGAVQ